MMMPEQFDALSIGDCFSRRSKEGGPVKEYRIVTKQGDTVLAHPKGDPGFRITFYRRQHEELTRSEGWTETPVKHPDNEGRPRNSTEAKLKAASFPVLAAEPLGLANVPGAPKRISVALDGVLSKARPASADIGDPNPGAIDFLSAARESGLRVTIGTSRDPRSVRRWLQIYGGDHLVEDIEVIHVDEFDLYLLPKCVRFEGVFPTIEELQNPGISDERRQPKRPERKSARSRSSQADPAPVT
jgi:hypothetical protein